MTATETGRRHAYLVDEDGGNDYLHDAHDPTSGYFGRGGRAYLAATARGFDVWVAVPDRWIDAADLFGRYAGPGDLPVRAVDRWFPGTTASGHRYNIHAHWYALVAVAVGRFDLAKRAAAVALDWIETHP